MDKSNFGNIGPIEANNNFKPKNRVRYSRLCFTLNNWTDAEYRALTEFPAKWMVIGKETSKTGTPHLQGAAVLQKQTDHTTLKKSDGWKRCHLESMRGTPLDSLAYCMKEDKNAFVKGELPAPGKRSDLSSAAEALREGSTLRDLALSGVHDVVVIKYFNNLQKYRLLIGTPCDRPKPTVIWLYGDTGVGKTRAAVEVGRTYDGLWLSNGPLKWFDGYNGEPFVVFDDIRFDCCSFEFLLRLLDRYPLRVEFKGGFVDWLPSVIVVTSPMSPSYLFSSKPNDDIAQLLRRIDAIIEFTGSSDDTGRLYGALGRTHHGLSTSGQLLLRGRREGSGTGSSILSGSRGSGSVGDLLQEHLSGRPTIGSGSVVGELSNAESSESGSQSMAIDLTIEEDKDLLKHFY